MEQDQSRALHRAAAVATSLSAVMATSLIADPVGAQPGHPCALERTAAHHSEGIAGWDPAYPRPKKTLDAVMVYLSFPDSEPLTSPDELTGDHFPATAEFFERASYGQFRLRVDARERWIRMPSDSLSYGIARDWDPTARSRFLNDAVSAADRKVDFRDYDVVYLVADPDAPGVDSDATKVVNFETPMRADGTDLHRIVTVFEQHPPDRNVLAHETGHVFDLPDLYHRPLDGRADWDTHVGDWDLMGSQFGLAPDPFGWHKWKLGWLGDDQVGCAANPGSDRFTLHALSAPTSPQTPPRGTTETEAENGAGEPRERGGNGKGAAVLRRDTRLVVVPTGATTAVAVEARGRYANDRHACTEGVLVYRVHTGTDSGGGPVEVVDGHPRTAACHDTSVYPPLADAPLGEGESLELKREGVRVEVTGRTADGGWGVRVVRGAAKRG
ncbi:peptidase M6 [Streptomyces sp. WAC 06738]|uniref:M6 family metalloprotease domain-containing protein n=1 Tax=Streptomyces sp. WAC 06738 TaxID=2203210 RepID=UPI000F720E06|nr:M6 family metalloprotease domain-containing protein [Streptomyces sp. WAC 06738]AZM46207.1 peptidase M6 [Streptomyces sp. WAC 06738]